MTSVHHWTAALFACCPGCRKVFWHCPRCGQPQGRRVGDRATFPFGPFVDACTECRLEGAFTVLGWSLSAQLESALSAADAVRPEPMGPRRSINEWAADPDLASRIRRAGAGVFAQVAAFHRRAGKVPRRAVGTPSPSRLIYTKTELIAALDYIAQSNQFRGVKSNG